MENKRKVAIVCAKFNEEITDRLLKSAKDTVVRLGGHLSRVVRVPGAFEIPVAAKMLAVSNNPPEAIICLGAVIQGQTDQNVHLVRSVMVALQQVQVETGIPVCTGLISAKNTEMARRRTEGDLDRGKEAAEAAIEMAGLRREFLIKTPLPVKALRN